MMGTETPMMTARISITATYKTKAQYTSRQLTLWLSLPRDIWTPTRPKIKVFKMCSRVDQTFSIASLEMTMGQTRYAKTRAAATVAKMPDAWPILELSARKNDRYAAINVMDNCTSASALACLLEARDIQYTATAPTRKPRHGEKKTMRVPILKRRATDAYWPRRLRDMSKNTVNKMTAVPSFSNDSEFICIDRPFGAPKLFINVSTATGSVAARMAPMVKQNVQLQPYGNRYLMTKPVKYVEARTAGPARKIACLMVCMKTRMLSFITSPKRSAGMKT
mmetsp:Transcript_16603/g.50281  ORF Transcript_16603/g.50281 Transcript_16603/m.50281 type:complete len:279 (-) Transcript_16603:1471-2307(-)